MRRQLATAVVLVVVFTLALGLGYSLVVTGIGELAFGHQADGSLVRYRGAVIGSSLLGQPFTDARGRPVPGYFQSRPSDALTSTATGGVTVSEASNLGPSNPLLIGFVPAVNTVGLDGRPSRSNPFATTADPFCLPMGPPSDPVPVTEPEVGARYLRLADGTYACDPDTVPERAISYRREFALAPDAPVPVDAVTASGSGLDPDISIANADLQAPTVARARGLATSRVLRLVAAHTTGRSLGVLGDPGVDVLTLNLALDGLAAHSPRAGT